MSRLGRPALAVKVYNEMAKAGIQPNAVTYGFYKQGLYYTTLGGVKGLNHVYTCMVIYLRLTLSKPTCVHVHKQDIHVHVQINNHEDTYCLCPTHEHV